MERKENLWDKELWTQNEVAGYFRVVPGTVKNWREQGLLSYWQAPGSSRVLYHRDDIKDFRDKNSFNKKGGDAGDPSKGTIKGRPVISAKTDEDWRI
ncbi:helix-turn-helix domain-containing protein [Desulfosarcina ovata]|uniref:Helix-turn-helix domain-containing protein n=1 Tax=Desulfosarcina ovata subsp. ovata TaxID=2752305 RepID=A0A5K8AHF8_9BACT|nr:helix-turn-helix domain-containing protein [Desulfosarcina ovata]BBO92071.1 hypothetical protein DSCOOX_52510 [Desulfosarcina ovata subsp. ovata]